MSNQNELLNLIEKRITAIDKYISSITFDNINEIIKNKKLIEQNSPSDNLDFISQFDLEELKQILPSSFESSLANLSFYINILKTSYARELSKQPEVINQIKEILSQIYSYLNKTAQEQEQNRRNIINFAQNKINLEKIKNKIVSNEEEFDEKEMEIIYSLLNSLEDRNKAVELLISFGEELLKTKETTRTIQEEEQLIENENPHQVKEELIIIFKKFGLDFNIFYNELSNSEQNEFINYVKPTNVEEILIALKEFNISLNDTYYNCQLISHKAKQLKELFMYSNIKTMKNVLNCIDKEQIYNSSIVSPDGKIKTSIDFDLLLESPARFIERKHRYKHRGNEIIDIKFGQDSIGAANDFIKNIELFKSLGVAPSDFCKNSKVSIIATEKIKKTISIFELYGIDKYYFTKTLSCFDSIHQADAIDQFIELGQFNYIVRNMSRCQLLPDSIIFYRLLYGIKYTNLPMESMITKKGNLSTLITDTSRKEDRQSFEITNSNKQRMVNQTSIFYGNNELYQTYNGLVNPLSSDITLVQTREDSIIHLLDNNFLVRKSNGEIVYPNTYSFGTIDTPRGKWNIIISRNKVLRICNELMQHNVEINDMDTIMFIITKNSILTEEEYNIIYRQIESIRKKGVER